MTDDPFHICGPALIQFSGGRTSAYMLYRIVQAHGGTLPPDVRITFANTGREMPQSLDFIHECSERWGVEVVWVEYRAAEEPKDRWHRVTYQSAARNGEPFSALNRAKNYLPNPVTRHCTQTLKLATIHSWAKSVGLGDADRIIGFRADERHRLARVREREESGKDGWVIQTPLIPAGIVKADITDFWLTQNFDLRLPNVGGRTPYGNCDLCFLKSAAQISGMMRDFPHLATWWIEAEAETRASKPLGALFRSDRPSYAEMFKAVQEQHSFDFGDRDELIDCFCGDPA